MAIDTILFNKISPLSFLNWLETRNTVSPDITVNFKLYQDYIKEWNKLYQKNIYEGDSFFTTLYIDVLREITLNFTSEEEKRFIINFDYTKEENLDIILPFFIKKIKSICLYYSVQREKLKELVSILPYKGTNFSISKVVKNIILNSVETGKSQKLIEGRTLMPSLSVISKNLNVNIEELYDDTDYFNLENELYPQIGLENIDNIVDYELYKNFKTAIVETIRQYPLYEDSLVNYLSFNIALSGSELNLLKERDFINYVKTNSDEDLKLNLKKRLALKYVSSNFYYLSVGETVSDILSGLLFTNNPLSGQPIQNITNVNNPTVAYSQNLNNLYTAYYMGNFFTPVKTGILKYNTFNKNYYINYSKLSKNSVYVFPDPELYEGENETPIIYKINLTNNKIGIQNQFRFGDVLSDRYDQLFYPYESLSQDIISQPYGLSLAVDNVDFWDGDQSSEWTDVNLWPGLDKVEKLPIEARHQSLLFNEGICTDWYDDIYGNQFGLYKQLPNDYLLSDKKKLITGKLYLKNTTTGLVSTFQHFYKNLLYKYPIEVIDDIEKGIKSIFLVSSLFIIETEKYVIADTYNFNLETGKFENSLLPSFYYPTYKINKNIEKFVNSYFVESTNTLYLCFLTLLPELSASNYKSIVPNIFKIDVTNFKVSQSYPSMGYDSTVYSLSGSFNDAPEIDFRYIKGGKFSFKEKQNVFNLTYLAYNLNRIPFIVNEQFSIQGGEEWLVTSVPIVNKPFVYTHDVNFSNPEVDHTFRYGATYSEVIGNKDRYNFTWSVDNQDNDNFHFCSNINPVVINIPGSHYVNFDWNKYIFGNVFIGCDGITVSKIDNETIIDRKDGSSILILNEPDKWYWVFDKEYYSNIFSVSARYIKNTENAIVQFYISSNTDTFSGVFCNNISSIYKIVNIEVTGSGLGDIKSDPFCVACGELGSIVSAKVEDGGLGYSTDSLFITISSNSKPTSTALLKANLNTGTGSVTSVDVLRKGAGYTKDSVIHINGNYSVSASIIPEFRSYCTFLYPQYGTISFIPSAGFESIFTGWRGEGCEGVANRCLYTVNESQTLTANFFKIPRYKLTIATNQPTAQVISLDGLMNYPLCSSRTYLEGSTVVLSANDLLGYQFVEFRNTECGPNNPCGIALTKNLTVTAFYLSAIVEFDIYKSNPITFDTGYIMAKLSEAETGVATLYSSQGDPLIYASADPSLNTIYCSLCPDLPIKAFQRFTNIPRGTSIELSAVPDDDYIFNYYKGSPCENSGGSTCNFVATRYRSITGYFNYPTYTVTLVITGGLQYTTDNVGINCGNGFLNRFRRTCSFSYISGTVVSLTAFTVGTGGMLYLSSYDMGGVISDVPLDGSSTLSYDYLVTKSFTVTAAALPTRMSNFTFIKSGSNLFKGYVNSIVTIDAGPEHFYVVGQNTELSTFTIPDFSEIIITNIFIPFEYRYLYTTGFSAIKHIYESGAGISVFPSPTAEVYVGEPVLLNLPLIINGSDAPIYNENIYDLIKIENKEAYLTLTQNTTAISLYSLNTLAEEMLLSSISTEQEDIISVLV